MPSDIPHPEDIPASKILAIAGRFSLLPELEWYPKVHSSFESEPVTVGYLGAIGFWT